jgi:hypothetical protein
MMYLINQTTLFKKRADCRSYLAFGRGAVLHLEEPEDLLLRPHDGDLAALPDLLLPVALLLRNAVVRQQQTHVMSLHSHLPVEQVAAGEVHEGEGVLLDWVVLDVDPMVLSLEEAHPHVGRRVLPVERLRLGQTFSHELRLFEKTDQVCQ